MIPGKFLWKPAPAPILMDRWQTMETAPRDDTEILTWDGWSITVQTYAYDDKWQAHGMPSYKPTHWMPLPKPPSK